MGMAEPEVFAKNIVSSLEAVKEFAGASGPVSRGVAKLGFSWEALDVKHWAGDSGLVNAIEMLHAQEYIDSRRVGQSHRAPLCLVQEFVVHDFEMRMYVVEGAVEHITYTKFNRIDDAQAFKDFQEES